MGIADAHMDEMGYVYGTVPGGRICHHRPDRPHGYSEPDASGKNIKARVVKYDGGDILLNQERADLEGEIESLARNVGKHLIVTDGTTLLGADDKAVWRKS